MGNLLDHLRIHLKSSCCATGENDEEPGFDLQLSFENGEDSHDRRSVVQWKDPIIEPDLQKRRNLFDQQPRRVLYYHGTLKPPLMSDVTIEFHHGLPSAEEIESFDHDFVVLDELMEDTKSKHVTQLFSQVAHHSHVTFFLLIQNFFHLVRSQTLHAHYLFFMMNPRDKLQIRNLAIQMYPNNPKFLVEAFEDATYNRPYSHLFIDLTADCVNTLRVRANIFDPVITVYRQKKL